MRAGISIIFLLISITVFSQEDALKVFFCKGDIHFKREWQEEWLELSLLDLKLKNHDSLALGNESVLYLLDNESRLFYLSHPGKFQIIALIDSIESQGGSSLFSRYSCFLWDELNKPHKDIEKYSRRYLADKGGVSRAPNIPHVICPFYGSFILADQIDFSWGNCRANEYTLSFWDSYDNGDNLFTVTIADTAFSISTKQKWMPVNKVFYWAITVNRKPASVFIPIKVLDVESRNEIHKDIKAIKEETHASDEVGLLIIAAFYESHNLYHLANDSYLEAIRLNPENQHVKEYYHLFMARMGDF